MICSRNGIAGIGRAVADGAVAPPAAPDDGAGSGEALPPLAPLTAR
jgi:hypothetical protein